MAATAPISSPFRRPGAANVDVIKDYNFAAGDKIDVSDLIGPGFGADSNVADFVRVIPAGHDLRLQVDGDGPDNGHNWADVAILEGANTAGENPVSVVLAADPVIAEPDVFNVQTVALTTGGYAVTWTQTGADDGSADLNVYGRVYDAAGHQVGAEFEVSSDNALDDSENIAHGPRQWPFRRHLAVGRRHRNARLRCQRQRFRRRRAHRRTRGDNTLAQVVELSNGDYAALYSRTDVADANVYVRILDPNGVPVVNEIVGHSPSNNGLTDILHGAVHRPVGDRRIQPDRSARARLRRHVDLVSGPCGDFNTDVMVRVFDRPAAP